MARMIPPVIHADCASFGEKQIFKKLRDEPGTKNWIVLHSLSLPKHVRQTSGEIDFVVIVPEKGVLCVEVKACSLLSRRDGLWFYGKGSAGDPRGPFKQVTEGMHSLRKHVASEYPELGRVPFFTAVIFPYLDFNFKPGEWQEWEVIDRNLFRSMPTSTLLLSILDRWRRHFQNSKTGAGYVNNSDEPYRQQCEDLAVCLRGDFEAHESAQSIIARNIDELQRFTEEQFDALDSMENNPRTIFCGAAGTGKTFLALEAAKRADAEGHKTLLVCYNKLLAEWAKSVAKWKNVDVCTIHSLMKRFSTAVPGEDSALFWEQSLPEAAQMAVIERSLDADLYDTMIIDEGQDLLHSPYLDFLDLLLQGGLTAGQWRMFGDFEKQAVYRTSNVNLETFRHDRCGGVPEMRLAVNCRNTPNIGAWVEKFGQLHPGYSRFRRADGGVEPEMRFYEKREDQPGILLKLLDQLQEQGFSSQDIVILSPYDQDSSVIGSLPQGPWRDRLRPYKVAPTGHLGHATIKAFKGLEAQVVIVTDIDQIRGEDDLNLLYVALSRAVHKAVIFGKSSVKDSLLAMMSAGGRGVK